MSSRDEKISPSIPVQAGSGQAPGERSGLSPPVTLGARGNPVDLYQADAVDFLQSRPDETDEAGCTILLNDIHDAAIKTVRERLGG